MTETLSKLSASMLRSLTIALREGVLAGGITAHGVRQAVGAGPTPCVLTELQRLSAEGWTAVQLATLAEALAAAHEQPADPETILDLVLSGPEVAGIPTRDTVAVMHSLVEKAQQEVILVGYAVHDGLKLFAPLAKRMQQLPALHAWFCLNISRKFGDTSLESEIVRRFSLEFVSRHWPWRPRPDLYYDPRALSQETAHRASLHAKCLVVDRREALVTSANFTEAAQERNVEVGVIVKHTPLAERLASYFEGLRASGRLARCALPPGGTPVAG